MDTVKGRQGQRRNYSQKYAEYRERELNEKGEKNGRALGKHVIDLYSSGVSWVVKIRDVKK